MASFSFFTLLDAYDQRVAKSEAILAFQAAFRMVSLSNYCILCLFSISVLMKSGVTYTAI